MMQGTLGHILVLVVQIMMVHLMISIVVKAARFLEDLLVLLCCPLVRAIVFFLLNAQAQTRVGTHAKLELLNYEPLLSLLSLTLIDSTQYGEVLKRCIFQ